MRAADDLSAEMTMLRDGSGGLRSYARSPDQHDESARLQGFASAWRVCSKPAVVLAVDTLPDVPAKLKAMLIAEWIEACA